MMTDRITINGVELSISQATIFRVALAWFLADMNNMDALGADEVGHVLRESYLEGGKEILDLMGKRP